MPQGAAVIDSPCLSTCATPAAGRVCGRAAAAPRPAHADASAAQEMVDPAAMLAGLAEANAVLSRLQVPGEQGACPSLCVKCIVYV